MTRDDGNPFVGGIDGPFCSPLISAHSHSFGAVPGFSNLLMEYLLKGFQGLFNIVIGDIDMGNQPNLCLTEGMDQDTLGSHGLGYLYRCFFTLGHIEDDDIRLNLIRIDGNPFAP
jgi:hypothetical protein